MQRLHRISVGSAFKVSAVLSALGFGVLGFFFVFLPGLFGASILGALSGDQSGAAGGFVAALVIYIVGIVVYAIVSGIIGAIYAWLYNIVAGWTGGLEIELS